jgi:hypothetical protein
MNVPTMISMCGGFTCQKISSKRVSVSDVGVGLYSHFQTAHIQILQIIDCQKAPHRTIKMINLCDSLEVLLLSDVWNWNWKTFWTSNLRICQNCSKLMWTVNRYSTRKRSIISQNPVRICHLLCCSMADRTETTFTCQC